MGLFEGIGKSLNDLMGTTSGAKLNNAYQKEFAQNAHQWEVKDLEAAGLNPILSAGGSGASASGGGTTGSHGIDPITAIASSVNAYTEIQNAKKANAEAKNLDMDTLRLQAVTLGQDIDNLIRQGGSEYEIKQKKALYNKTLADMGLVGEQTVLTNAQTAKAQAETELTNQEKAKKQQETKKMQHEIKEIDARTDLTKEQKVKLQGGVVASTLGTGLPNIFGDSNENYEKIDPDLPKLGRNKRKKKQ